MEKMPYHQDPDDAQVLQQPATQVVMSDWQQKLPVLTGQQVVLRELRISDAASLFALLTAREVTRFISPRRRRSKGSSGSSRGRIGNGLLVPTRVLR